MGAELLIESTPFTFTLEESKDKPGKVIARGQFARFDRPTENKRYYGRHLWEREIKRLDESMKTRKVMGELDHPADGRTKLTRVSHLLTGLRIEGQEIIGEAEVMDTPNGRILKAIMAAGAQVGVSSRGFGSTKARSDGIDEVQEDFRLDTFDFVADPATRTAYPDVFTEERAKIPEDDMGVTTEELKKNYPGIVEEVQREGLRGLEEQVEARLTDSFSMKLREAIEKVRAEVYEQVVSEAQSDPNVAGAKQILERIASMVASFGVPHQALKAIEEKDSEISDLRDKLAERELEIKAAREETAEMSKLAREAAYTLRLEQKIAGHSSADTIRKLIGDVSKFEKVEDLDGKIEALLKEFTNANEEDETVEELRGRVADLEKELQGAKEEVQKANKRTLEAIEVGEAAESMLHLERRLVANPYADQVRTAAARQGIKSIEDADALLESFVPHRRPDEDEAERIRAAIARGKQRSLEEDTNGGRGNGKGNGQVGNPLSEVGIELSEDEFDHLSGQGQRLNS